MAEMNDEKNGKIHIISKWLKGSCFDYGAVYIAPGLLEMEFICLEDAKVSYPMDWRG